MMGNQIFARFLPDAPAGRPRLEGLKNPSTYYPKNLGEEPIAKDASPVNPDLSLPNLEG